MIRSQIGIFVLLFGLWLLLSGRWSPIMIGLGGFSVCLTMLLINRMQSIQPWSPPHPLRFYLKLSLHFARLLRVIFVAGLKVARLSLTPQLKPKSAFAIISMSQKTPLGCLTHANSITLTPGTISAEILDNGINVHILDVTPSELSQQKQLDQAISALEKIDA